MTNEEIIKKYLEEQIKVDSALAEKYNAKMVPDCIKAIISKAKTIAVKNAAMIKSETVFKWARDFFIDGDFGAVQADNEITEAKPKNKQSEEDVEERIRTACIRAKAEALNEFREEAKKKAEEAAAEKAAKKAAREAEQANIISLF